MKASIKSKPIHTHKEETCASNGMITFSFTTHKDQDPNKIRWSVKTNTCIDIERFLLEDPVIDVSYGSRAFDKDCKKWRVFYNIKHALTENEDVLAALNGKALIEVEVSGIELPVIRKTAWGKLHSSKGKGDVASIPLEGDEDHVSLDVKIKKEDYGEFINLMTANLSDFSVKKTK